YDVDATTGLLDYDAIAQQARKEKPAILLAGYSSYPRLINFAKMKDIADDVGAVLIADIAHFAGLVAGKAITGEYNPVPYADIITSTTHKTMRGPRGGFILCTEEFADIVDKGCPLVLGGPLPHVMAAKAVAFREASQPEFCEYASNVIDNAKSLAEGLLEGGAMLLTGGTDNHLVIIDVTKYGITGRHAESALREAGITVNRNSIPSDPNGPWYTSGVRIGTPATTTLGLGAEEMKSIANIIVDVLEATIPEGSSKAKYVISSGVLESANNAVSKMLKNFPLYHDLDISE
ncbi:MAG: aminotransferase class I/II-fold pyridoxal phosphate-dependent enzyme, partial [Waddliaceae bacterium]|nr:aminotransferase class I/II-fold pyridoxal phosphate-dependent enzyme [Waddliaceae bacterium]